MKTFAPSLLSPLLGCLLLLAGAARADGLVSLDDAEMGRVSGQSGIAADLVLNINTDPATGNPLASLSNCTGAGNPCRMAWNFYNRGSGAGQEWIVWKDFFGVLKLNSLWIDANQSAASNSPYPDNRAANRFMDTAGTTCLLDGSANTTTCYAASVNMPMLALQFNQGGANGLQLYMKVGGVVVEYGTTGYNSDSAFNTGKPAVALLIADKSGVDAATPTAAPANIKIGGKIGLYGF